MPPVRNKTGSLNLDWPLAISRNRDALRRIVAALFALAGAAANATLPRHVYAAVLLVLRPAESAVRRLIVIAAVGVALNPRAARPVPAGLPAFPAASAPKTPAFCLFDPLKHFSLDDFDNNALPRFSFDNSADPNFNTLTLTQADEPVDATQLFNRLRALRHALNDLPRQARRLARWTAKRDQALMSKGPFKLMRITPFRPGLPPGWRQRRLHEVDDVLRECHGLARYAVNGPDTG